MDPVTAAILAALPAVAPDLVRSGLKDAYDGLKAVIKRKWGEASPISSAIRSLEADPKSKGQAIVLQEKVEASGAAKDDDVVAAANILIEELKKANATRDTSSTINVAISGGTIQGVVGSGEVHIGNMDFSGVSKVKN